MLINEDHAASCWVNVKKSIENDTVTTKEVTPNE